MRLRSHDNVTFSLPEKSAYLLNIAHFIIRIIISVSWLLRDANAGH